ncbi:hypothetical protein JKP88DRAFT_172039, partial [Tribonema minus]
AVSCGYLSVLQWLTSVDGGDPLWHCWTCGDIASRGDLAMLRWARSAGCPWGICTIEHAIRIPLASKDLILEALTWALDNGCPCNSDERALYRSLQLAVPRGSHR